ncbi:DUF2247 family protein [Arthrobacter sp. M4]|uniref:DUF2247 family protein n=1 Tax=Arthrobacter sp. M4 TaxID=218160 RepID=UPI001CDB7C61|nr:DUF2247 family protein [Arthrobacter sp. M4]MCA4133407.1 DUF2247 family protein [Arthrobacter sp. M4]
MTVTFELEPGFILGEGVSLSADDLRFGLWHYYVKPLETIELAVGLVARGSADPVVQELAGLLHDETDRVEELLGINREHDEIPAEVSSDAGAARKWLYLQLKAAFLERRLLADPLAVVEQLYADFGQPSTISGFVRSLYAPPDEEPEERPLIQRWEQFLEKEHEALAG